MTDMPKLAQRLNRNINLKQAIEEGLATAAMLELTKPEDIAFAIMVAIDAAGLTVRGITRRSE